MTCREEHAEGCFPGQTHPAPSAPSQNVTKAPEKLNAANQQSRPSIVVSVCDAKAALRRSAHRLRAKVVNSAALGPLALTLHEWTRPLPDSDEAADRPLTVEDFRTDVHHLVTYYWDAQGLTVEGLARALEERARYWREQLCLVCGLDTILEPGHYYVLKDAVRLAVVPSGRGRLCMTCLGKRLGRPPTETDFDELPEHLVLPDAVRPEGNR